jgi:hypothetical protein
LLRQSVCSGIAGHEDVNDAERLSAISHFCSSTARAAVLPRTCAPATSTAAEGWEEMLLPEIERQQRLGKNAVFRAEAAFAKQEIYEALRARGAKYAIRIPVNDSL